MDSVVGGFSVGETPGPIPNPEAKPFSADGTALGRVWESRTLPTFNLIVGGWFVAMNIAGTNPPLFREHARDRRAGAHSAALRRETQAREYPLRP